VALERILDQPRAVDLLRRALASDRVAHAYAFVGPTGAGRMTTALAFAEELLESPSRQHPDMHVIVPTPPESNPRGARAIRIGAIRELERQASLRPAMGRRKVFVLDEAERMTAETPQAFLKTLEEPPAATVIILILLRARAVPATLLSRCQVVRFGARDDAGAATARAGALELLAEVRAQGVEALFRRTDHLEREKAEALVDAYWLFCYWRNPARRARSWSTPVAPPSSRARPRAGRSIRSCRRSMDAGRPARRSCAMSRRASPSKSC